MRMQWKMLAATVAVLAQGAMAGEFPYDFVACTHTKVNLLEGSADTVAYGLDNWGTVASSTTKDWENASTRCVGYVRVIGGASTGRGVCKWFNAAGDTAVGEFEWGGQGEPKFTWLSGTGKLKGIQGGGTFRTVFDAKPAQAGTSQGCRRDWGQYRLP